MKVAEDLGALWLLDEARRQRKAARSAGNFEPEQDDADVVIEYSEDEAIEAFKPVSDTTPAAKAARRSRQGIIAWIDGHGLVVAGVLVLAASLPWIFLARRSAAKPAPGDQITIQRLHTEIQTIKKELADATDREKVLRNQLDGSRNEVVTLKAALAGLRATPPMEPPETPLPQLVDLPQQVDTSRFPLDAVIWDKNGHGYKVFKETLSWPQAKQRCEELGGHLVTIASPEEQQFVLSIIAKAGISVDVRQNDLESWHDKLWAGGTDEDSEGNWRWVDGSPWGFANWLNGAPQQDGNFLDICPHKDGCWNDGGAKDFFIVGFICEWPRGTVAAREESIQTTRNVVEPASVADIHALPPLRNSIGIELKLIPAGTFQMGSNDGEPDEKPVHEVRITKPFYLGVTEVTNAQWKAVMGDVPSQWNDDNRPVEQVSWIEVMQFCEKLSARPAERAAGREYRLPTEAEWEYACRAGTNSRFSWGDDDGRFVDFAWSSLNAGGQTHPVCGKRPNAWGLHDMHGNVWEWCSDWYGPYAATGASDPTGPQQGNERVFRGSGWDVRNLYCRSAFRSKHGPAFRGRHLGFRLALSPSGASALESGTASKPRPDPGTLLQHEAQLGQTLAFNVVGSATSGSVWGSNPYTADSHLSKAVVHAGVLRSGESGLVRVTILPGQQAYAGSVRNGVMSSPWGPYSPAYKIEGVEQANQLPANATPHQVLIRPPLVNSIGMKLKLMPAGTFLMGSEEGDPDERPVHEVRITKPFYLGVYEVTNNEWSTVMGSVPSTWKDTGLPVETVTWHDVIAFCSKLSERPEEKKAGRAYRLPSEAEWEYACRAGSSTRFSFEEDEDASDNGAKRLDMHGWFGENAGGKTQPVGRKRRNPWGLYDMHGNVYEWCSDWYGSYSQNPVTDPLGPAEAASRVVRSGCWNRSAESCRSADRFRSNPSSASQFIGFRVALSLSGSSVPEAGGK